MYAPIKNETFGRSESKKDLDSVSTRWNIFVFGNRPPGAEYFWQGILK